jgi:hypothetical protein
MPIWPHWTVGIERTPGWSSASATPSPSGCASCRRPDFAINQIWLQLVLLAQDLLAWFAVLTLDGDLPVATPATIRYRLLHVAGRITRSSRRLVLHLDAAWPWAADLAEAFRRLRTLPTPA